LIMRRTQNSRMFLRLSIGIFILGNLFQIQHWPMGINLYVVGLLGIAISSYLLYSSRPGKRFIHELAQVLIPIWSVYTIVEILHFQFGQEIQFVLGLIAAVYTGVVWLRLNNLKNVEGGQKINWVHIVYLISVLMICLGLMMKHYFGVYAGLLVMLGVAKMIVAFMLEIWNERESHATT
jgi:hypothetical protein